MAYLTSKDTERGIWAQGEPFIWATAGALAIVLLTVTTLILVVMVNGLGVLWPSSLAHVTLEDGTELLGVITDEEVIPETEEERIQLKVGNRELYGGMDFRWVDHSAISEITHPDRAVALERLENGNFYGYFEYALVDANGEQRRLDEWPAFLNAWAEVQERLEDIEEVAEELSDINHRTENIRHELVEHEYEGHGEDHPEVQALQARKDELDAAFREILERQNAMAAELAENVAYFVDSHGTEKSIPLMEIVRPYKPNEMSLWRKSAFYVAKLGELLTEDPRESNTEGGLFPAIFGTVMLTFLMSLLSFPLGLLAGIYLRLYAKEGLLVRIVRIAVNNLAGIPSIVYGIFGLGFFVYGVGGTIDQLFFPERLPTPTYGTGGILWASLTLGILTVPVVIVATEEALGAIPSGMTDGALALGSTRFQTLRKVLLPMASPGIMTGFILAMARAAGEVAPLMITGVVKLAPTLPLDDQYPFLHLDRKFMHLGFHIYDIGFQSPNVEAAKPMVFVTTLLLVLLVLMMSSTAIYLRNKMRKRYSVTGI